MERFTKKQILEATWSIYVGTHDMPERAADNLVDALNALNACVSEQSDDSVALLFSLFIEAQQMDTQRNDVAKYAADSARESIAKAMKKNLKKRLFENGVNRTDSFVTTVIWSVVLYLEHQIQNRVN